MTNEEVELTEETLSKTIVSKMENLYWDLTDEGLGRNLTEEEYTAIRSCIIKEIIDNQVFMQEFLENDDDYVVEVTTLESSFKYHIHALTERIK